jgi:hypothetical protein
MLLTISWWPYIWKNVQLQHCHRMLYLAGCSRSWRQCSWHLQCRLLNLPERLFCGVVVVTNFMSTVGSLFRISASCILKVDRRGLVCVMVPHRSAPSWRHCRTLWLYMKLAASLNLEYERSEHVKSKACTTYLHAWNAFSYTKKRTGLVSNLMNHYQFI